MIYNKDKINLIRSKYSYNKGTISSSNVSNHKIQPLYIIYILHLKFKRQNAKCNKKKDKKHYSTILEDISL